MTEIDNIIAKSKAKRVLSSAQRSAAAKKGWETRRKRGHGGVHNTASRKVVAQRLRSKGAAVSEKNLKELKSLARTHKIRTERDAGDAFFKNRIYRHQYEALKSVIRANGGKMP